MEDASFPTRVGSYELVLPIASGGMATVYLARQHGLGGFEREVALKLMHPHLREERAWYDEFIEEAKLSARIRHPNVVQVLDVGDDPSGTYLVMDYIEGDTLARLARAARERSEELPRAVAMRALCDALAGLHAAHELRDERGFSLGVVHRDFSPQNVLVGLDGITRLADFGIAKASSRVTHTQTGSIKGKVAYMSPEQARGEAVDRRTDVWAAGVLAWEILAGRRLYTGDPISIGLKIVSERPPRLRDVDPSIPRALDEAVASALEPRLEARCATADELRRQLSEATSLADLAEVSAWATRLCEDALAERRTRFAELRRVRARAIDDATIVTPMIIPRPKRRGVLIGAAVIVAVFAAGVLARSSIADRSASPSPSPSLVAVEKPVEPVISAPSPVVAPVASVTTSPSTTMPPKKKPKPLATSKTKPLAPNPYE